MIASCKSTKDIRDKGDIGLLKRTVSHGVRHLQHTIFLAGIRGCSRVAETALYLPLPRTRDVPRLLAVLGQKSSRSTRRKGARTRNKWLETRAKKLPMLFPFVASVFRVSATARGQKLIANFPNGRPHIRTSYGELVL